MNWLKFLHTISNNESMAWIPLLVFVLITVIGMLYGIIMGWVGAIAMLVWNYIAYIILNIFIGSFTSLLNAYQVSEYLPNYILEPMIIGLWLLIANVIGYFIMFLLKNKITSRMKRYSESDVSVWQDRIIGAGIMVVGSLPVSIFGASIIAVTGDETGATAELYGIGLRGMSFGRYDTISRAKDDFNNYYDLVSNDEATELFTKLMVMDEEWLDTKYSTEEDADGNLVQTGITQEWLDDVKILNEFRDNIESIINSPDLGNHVIDQIYNISTDRDIEVSRKNIVNADYDPDYVLGPGEVIDPEITNNPFVDVMGVSEHLFGTNEGQILGYDVSNTGILILQNFITQNLINYSVLDESISENSNLDVDERRRYIERYTSSYLQAYSHVESD